MSRFKFKPGDIVRIKDTDILLALSQDYRNDLNLAMINWGACTICTIDCIADDGFGKFKGCSWWWCPGSFSLLEEWTDEI